MQQQYQVSVLLLLAVFILLQTSNSTVNITEFRKGEQRYYNPSGALYDLYNGDTFLESVKGSIRYSTSFWFKADTLSSGESGVLLHLTMLENETPDDYSSYPSSQQHLSQLMYCTVTSSNLITCTTSFIQSSFAPTQVISTTISFNVWYFLYFGVDFESNEAVVAVSDPFTNKLWSSQLISLGTTKGNEALDERFKYYIGGTVDKTSGLTFRGYVYNPVFYANYCVTEQVVAYNMIYQEFNKLYRLNLNVPSTMYIMDYTENTQVYMSFGSNGLYIPKFNVGNGLSFDSTLGEIATIITDFDFSQPIFISFNLKLTQNCGSASKIFTIYNTEGDVIFGLMCTYTSANQFLVQSDTSTLLYYHVLSLNVFMNIMVVIQFQPFYNEIFFDIIKNGELNSLYQNEVFTTSVPSSRITSQEIVFGGTSTFTGYISDIVGGIGSFFLTDGSTPTITGCLLEVGVVNPICLYCDVSNGYYLNETSNCVTSCIAGTYEDTDRNKCRQCFSQCDTCDGPEMNDCLTCSPEFPYSFDGYCFQACPTGTTATLTESCICDSSCADCSWDNALNSIVCTACASSTETLYIKDEICVKAVNCNYGTFGNSDLTSLKCDSTCGTAIKDWVTKKCVSSCDLTTSVASFDGTECLQSCPDGQYASSSSQCTNCDSSTNKCASCESLTKCTKCVSGYLLHEHTYKCKLACDTGFVQDGNICRVCKSSCTQCPTDYLYFSASCYSTCPGGYMSDTNNINCILNPYPVVSIEDNGAIWNIGRRTDLYIYGSYEYIGDIKSVKWSLTGSTSSYATQFFAKSADNYTTLIIPFTQLESNVHYYLKLTVTATITLNEGYSTLEIITSQAINTGDFSVTPLSGIAGNTTFTISYSSWTAAEGTLYYDVTYSREYTTTIRGYNQPSKQATLPILLSATQALSSSTSVDFVFPISQYEEVVQIELKVYTEKEETTQTIDITLYQYSDSDETEFEDYLTSYKSNVWWITQQGNLTLDEYILRSGYLYYLYETDRLYSINILNSQKILKQKKILDANGLGCDDSINCRENGECSTNSYDSSFWSCTCLANNYGDFCDWNERDIQIMTNATYTILYNIQDEISQESTFSILQIINKIAKVEDGLSKKSFRLIKTILNNILAQDEGITDVNKLVLYRTEIYNSVFDSLSYLIYQSVNRPSMREDEKEKYSQIFKEILNNYLDQLHSTLIRLNEDYLFQNQFLTIYTSKKLGTQFISYGNNPSNYVVIPLSKSVIVLPQSEFTLDEPVLLNIIQWNFDPIYPQTNQMGVQVEVNLLSGTASSCEDGTYLDSVSNPSKPSCVESCPTGYFGNSQTNKCQLYLTDDQLVKIFFQKIAAYPPIGNGLSNSFYQCQYLYKEDEQTYEWITDNLGTFAFENEYYIQCNYNHYSHYSVAQGLMEFIDDMPSLEVMQYYTMKFLSGDLSLYSNETFDYDQWITICNRTYLEPRFPTSKINFNWKNPSFIICLLMFCIYFLISLLNKIRLTKNAAQIYTKKNQDVLLMSYSPLISMVLFGETAISHTYQMRLTKFFSLIIGYSSLVAVSYRQLKLVNPRINDGQLIFSSTFFGIFVTAGVSYVLEGLYYLINQHVQKSTRSEFLYCFIFICNMILFTFIGAYTSGYTESNMYGQYVLSFVLAIIFDMLILDTVAVIYAYYALDTPFLKFLAFRGFYIQIDPQFFILLPQNDQIDDISDNQNKKINMNDPNIQQVVMSNLDVAEKEQIKIETNVLQQSPTPLQPVVQDI